MLMDHRAIYRRCLGLENDEPLPPTLVRIHEEAVALQRHVRLPHFDRRLLLHVIETWKLIDGPRTRIKVWNNHRPFAWEDVEPGTTVYVDVPGESRRIGSLYRVPKKQQGVLYVAFDDSESKYEHIIREHCTLGEILPVEWDETKVNCQRYGEPVLS